MKKAIITGITGQDGAYLSKLLLEKNYKVVGITRNLQSGNLNGLSFLGVENDIELVEANVFDLSNVIRLLEKYKPEEFYNLAAQSSVGLSFEQPIGTLEYNIISIANILESIRIVNKEIKIYQSSSSEMFGNVPEKFLPLDENCIIHPASPYAISKATAHWVSINYREAYNMFISSGILFNHESVLRRQNFVTKKIISGAVKIKNKQMNKLRIGNTNIRRDWGYAPKYIEAMWSMLNIDNPGDYIICSGEHHSLQEFINKTFNKLELDATEYVISDSSLLRPLDLRIMYGNPERAKKELSWNYDLTFDELVEKLVEDEISYYKWSKKHLTVS